VLDDVGGVEHFGLAKVLAVGAVEGLDLLRSLHGRAGARRCK
jgi:hypothetical protein